MNKQWINQLPINNIQNVNQMSGGDVNDAYQIETKDEVYFLLVQPNHSQDFFANEIASLKELAKANVTVPKVHGNGEINGDAFLLMDFLERGQGSYNDLGRMVAKMHKYHSETNQFGFNYPYEGGEISFSNEWTSSWSELFVERRLDGLRDAIVNNNLWNSEQEAVYKSVRSKILEDLSNHESVPSLLHGDLWGGNHMFLKDGTPALFDPDSLYGDREFDLGATVTFNVYPAEFYEAYEKEYPLSDEAYRRIEFYRLYILMIHLNKFGGIYATRVDQSMNDILNERTV